MRRHLQIQELNLEEIKKRRQGAHTLMGTLAGLFFVWLMVIYWTGFFQLASLGFVFLFLAILKYIDIRYYDTVLRIMELKKENERP